MMVTAAVAAAVVVVVHAAEIHCLRNFQDFVVLLLVVVLDSFLLRLLRIVQRISCAD